MDVIITFGLLTITAFILMLIIYKIGERYLWGIKCVYV